MAFECIRLLQDDPVADAYLAKYASLADEYLRLHDYRYRTYREIKFNCAVYAMDKERDCAYFEVNRGFSMPGVRSPATGVLFVKGEMVVVNFVRIYLGVESKEAGSIEVVYKIMPFDAIFGKAEEEGAVRGLIEEALICVGLDGESYDENVRLRVVFNVQFSQSVFE